MIRTGKEKEENKEKERKNRGRRRYGQAKYRHAKKGVFSCWIAGGVLLLTAAVLGIAYMTSGTAATYIGGLGFVAFLSACFGCWNAFRGFKERDKNYITCKFGVGFNVFFILIFVSIFCRGLG